MPMHMHMHMHMHMPMPMHMHMHMHMPMPMHMPMHMLQVRPSRLQPSSDNDYRYASRSVPLPTSEGKDPPSEIDAALARDLSTQSGALTGRFAGGSSAGVQGYAYQNAQGP